LNGVKFRILKLGNMLCIAYTAKKFVTSYREVKHKKLSLSIYWQLLTPVKMHNDLDAGAGKCNFEKYAKVYSIFQLPLF